MFKRLLLPLDLTDKHAPVVATAAELAKKSGGSVALLHVVELIPGLSRDEDRAFYDRLEKQARAHMDRVGQALTAQKVAWKAELRFGPRVQETVRFAQEEQCDLIIMTAPTFDPAHPTLGWGSLSFKISMLSSAPVLLVKG
ncbi:MAG TPA: universal stress protein [Gemmataceae bacterium]|nr:universal stress protein [Gemmataceae bacterium]